MAHYVDGFLIVIKKKKVAEYKKMATIGRSVWMDHGALNYYECVGDDLNAPMGVSFLKLAGAKKDETVVFAFITFKSKAHRNRVNAKVHKDKRMQPEQFKGEMPFDMKRFSYGGFEAIVRSK